MWHKSKEIPHNQDENVLIVQFFYLYSVPTIIIVAVLAAISMTMFLLYRKKQRSRSDSSRGLLLIQFPTLKMSTQIYFIFELQATFY